MISNTSGDIQYRFHKVADKECRGCTPIKAERYLGGKDACKVTQIYRKSVQIKYKYEIQFHVLLIHFYDFRVTLVVHYGPILVHQMKHEEHFLLV